MYGWYETIPEMDERRDRYERIVKLSRDVNIECKRIIFHLHRTATAKTPEDRGEFRQVLWGKWGFSGFFPQEAEEGFSVSHGFFLTSPWDIFVLFVILCLSFCLWLHFFFLFLFASEIQFIQYAVNGLGEFFFLYILLFRHGIIERIVQEVGFSLYCK